LLKRKWRPALAIKPGFDGGETFDQLRTTLRSAVLTIFNAKRDGRDP
jgi:hypothetical protein